MARTTVWITGDQVSPFNSALRAVDRREATVLMIESIARSRQKPYHKRKLVLVFAAMRGFADDLRAEGWKVDYYTERDDFESALGEHVAAHAPERFTTMAQSEFGVAEAMRAAVAVHGLELDVTPHANFVSTQEDFEALFEGSSRSRVTMETFYRRMRRKTGLLMDGDQPAGGLGISMQRIACRPSAACNFRPNLAQCCVRTARLPSKWSSGDSRIIRARSVTSTSPSRGQMRLRTRTIFSSTASMRSDRMRTRW